MTSIQVTATGDSGGGSPPFAPQSRAAIVSGTLTVTPGQTLFVMVDSGGGSGATRTVAFGLIGIFFIKAAVEYDPHEAVGLDGALSRLTTQAYGSALLVIVACGLIFFGVYSLADARFRKI